jgi:2-polyprenyl-3-methyl-5-hydroxy-6-metoxy-1,4-benzoquinol methylase
MDILKAVEFSMAPELYEPGSAVMWTDPYISEQLLQVHLNPDIDLASRKAESIEKTVSWILTHLKEEGMNILDLGCGPGLYTQKIAMAGHKVTGVDFSKVSIQHAKKEAGKNSLDIQYFQQNYLDLKLGNEKFDLVLMIYTDFGVLNPKDRGTLLKNIKAVLKPGGILIFDVLNDKELNTKISPRAWEASQGGFWRPGPYIALSESIMYEDEKVILSQHTIIEDQKTEVYRFWTHFYNHNDLKKILTDEGFKNFTFEEDILPGDDLWNGSNLTFCIAQY